MLTADHNWTILNVKLIIEEKSMNSTLTNLILFLGLIIISITAGTSQGTITGWSIFGIGLIIIALIEKMDN